MPPRFVARQLACPTGLFGEVIGRLMNRHNAKMNAFALKLLDVQPSDRVLEIGFGGGLNLPLLLERAAFVAGVDRSGDVARGAGARFAREVAAGRAEFREGRVEELPFESSSFDKVCTVNTVYFWQSLDRGCREIARVLAPGGRVAVGFLPKEWMDRGGFPGDIFTSRDSLEVAEGLGKAGLREVTIERPSASTRWNVVIAAR